MNRFYLFALCLFFLSFCDVYAQNPLGAPLVNNYGKSVFQGGSRTYDIRQDSKGIMYFGNNEGLLTFDGKYWKQYKLPNQTIVRSIYIDNNDRIYVGGQGEFGYFEQTKQIGLQYTSLYSQIPEAYRQFADVWHTVEYENGIYFMSSNYIFSYHSNKIKVYPATVEWEYMDYVSGKLYAQERENGLLSFENSQWVSVSKATHFQKAKIAGILDINRDSTLIFLQNNKSFLLHNKNLTHHSVSPSHTLYTPSFAKIDDHRYVFATATDGCMIRTLRDGKFLEQIGVTEGLSNKNVSTVFVDNQQNIWAAIDNAIAVISYGAGIRYLRPNIDYDVTGYSTRVFDNSLYLSSSNGVYRAMLDKNVADQSQSPGKFQLVNGSDGGEAWRLNELNGHLLLTHNTGLLEITKDNISPIIKGVGSWLTLPLSAVYPVNYSLVGTYHGLDLLGYDGNKFSLIRKLKGTFDSFRFLELDEKYIWASHPYRGIYQIKLNEARTTYDTKLYTQKEGLPSSYQNYVYKIGQGIVFATQNGLYEYDEAQGGFYASSRLDVFKNIPVKYLMEDRKGNIWFCSEKKVGVAKLDNETKEYKIIYFPEIEGMNTSGFENIYSYDDQNVYIGSEKGILHVNFQKYMKARERPKALISSIVAIGSQDSLFQGGNTEKDLIVLNSMYNSFHFEFSSPNFGIYEHVSYSFWLEGYDKTWSLWSSNTEKDYTNLPSGIYNFKIKVKNNLNQESEISSFHFRILPPWYKSVWAYLFYFILLIIIIYCAYNMQKREWEKQQLKYEKEMKQLRYIHQLEVEKNEKEIVKLQNEKLEHEVMAKTKELASTSMQLMENSGALTKLRVELSKFAHIDQDTDLSRITSLLKDVENNTTHWDQFASHFDELNDGFFSRLKQKHAELSRNDLKVCAYLRLNFSTKQIAQLQSISVRGVEIHRYRLRKKLNIPTNISLGEYLSTL
jgi:ligand-binding sensor domain-containing protein/DNA-binding CsgD family transcriptional regulator